MNDNECTDRDALAVALLEAFCDTTAPDATDISERRMADALMGSDYWRDLMVGVAAAATRRALEDVADDVEAVIGQWPGNHPDWIRTQDLTFNGALIAVLRFLRGRASGVSADGPDATRTRNTRPMPTRPQLEDCHADGALPIELPDQPQSTADAGWMTVETDDIGTVGAPLDAEQTARGVTLRPRHSIPIKSGETFTLSHSIRVSVDGEPQP